MKRRKKKQIKNFIYKFCQMSKSIAFYVPIFFFCVFIFKDKKVKFMLKIAQKLARKSKNKFALSERKQKKIYMYQNQTDLK